MPVHLHTTHGWGVHGNFGRPVTPDDASIAPQVLDLAAFPSLPPVWANSPDDLDRTESFHAGSF